MPAYRTILPGFTGTDVVQLQNALDGLGLMRGTEDGYGPITQEAVRQLYSQLGYTANETGADEVKAANEAARSAADGVRQADQAVEDAQIALSRAKRPLPNSGGILQHMTDTPITVPISTKNDDSGSGDGGSGSATGGSGPANGGSGTPSSNPVLSGPSQQEKQTHQDAINDAQRALERAQEAADRARETRDEANAALAKAQAAAGVTLPLSEVVYIAKLPATVDTLTTGLGKPAEGTGLTLASGTLGAVAADLDPALVDQVKQGMVTEIITDDATSHPATVGAVTKKAAENDPGQERASVSVVPDKPIDGLASGASVRLVVHIAQSKEPVLNVALAALTTDATGASSVVVQDADAKTRTVKVTVGAQGDGRVEISGDVKEGDAVLIGPAPSPSPAR